MCGEGGPSSGASLKLQVKGPASWQSSGAMRTRGRKGGCPSLGKCKCQIACHPQGVRCVDFTSININKCFRERKGEKGPPRQRQGGSIRPGMQSPQDQFLGRERQGQLAGKPPDFTEPESWRGLGIAEFCPHAGAEDMASRPPEMTSSSREQGL